MSGEFGTAGKLSTAEVNASIRARQPDIAPAWGTWAGNAAEATEATMRGVTVGGYLIGSEAARVTKKLAKPALEVGKRGTEEVVGATFRLAGRTSQEVVTTGDKVLAGVATGLHTIKEGATVVVDKASNAASQAVGRAREVFSANDRERQKQSLTVLPGGNPFPLRSRG